MNQGAFPVIAESVRIPMRDGVKLSAHVHRPAAAGAFPAVLSSTPYRKGPLAPGSHHPIVGHGYATVVYDVRGTGDSEGWNDCIYSDADRQDSYDLVAWAAGQPWCNGNVGMWGISYGAVASLQLAMLAPPHLKAIIARSGTDDPYTEWTNPGGSPRPYIYMCYAPIMSVSNFSPPDPAEVGDEWSEIWNTRLEHSVPWGVSFIENLLDGPFWRARSLRGKYDRVRCPVFVVDGWADWYHTPLLRTFANLKVPKRALIGPWSHRWPDAAIPGPQIDWTSEALKWFDCWLKGIDTGITTEPPVTLFVREFSPPAPMCIEDCGSFQRESDWPSPRAMDTAFFLRGEGRLDIQPPADDTGAADTVVCDPRVGVASGIHGGGPFNDNWAMPLDQRIDEASSLVYTTEPLGAAVEIIGQPRMVLHCVSTAKNPLVAVKLSDVAPDGTSVLVTKGYLNAAHRESCGPPSYIEPGRACRIEVELLACAYRILKDHRIRIVIAGSDFLNVWPAPEPGRITALCNARQPSCVFLPIAHPRQPPLAQPNVRVNPKPPKRPERPDRFVIGRDMLGATQTLEYAVRYDPQWTLDSTMTVSAEQPARAVVRATSERSYDYAGQHIVVTAHCVTSSDEAAFHHDVAVEIAVNGKPYFGRKWSKSVPRRFM